MAGQDRIDGLITLTENALVALTQGGDAEAAGGMLGTILEGLQALKKELDSVPRLKLPDGAPVAQGGARRAFPSLAEIALQIFVAGQGLTNPRSADACFEQAAHFIAETAKQSVQRRGG